PKPTHVTRTALDTGVFHPQGAKISLTTRADGCPLLPVRGENDGHGGENRTADSPVPALKATRSGVARKRAAPTPVPRRPRGERGGSRRKLPHRRRYGGPQTVV